MRSGIKVKICGVTRVRDALAAAELGADFVGLNFHPPSPRYVVPERAREIASALPASVRRVGVFVNLERREVERIAELVGLDLLQFHGDETAAELEPFAARAIKAVRVKESLQPADLRGWEGFWGVLVDSHDPRLYGGTGTSWRFASLGELERAPRRIFVAGGLGPGNVRDALRGVRPYGIDLCSGVESRPGVKDPSLLRALFEELDDGDRTSAA